MSDERIITAANVTTGEKNDGKYLQELVMKSKATGMEIETVIGTTLKGILPIKVLSIYEFSFIER